jgi:hypothetical protein
MPTSSRIEYGSNARVKKHIHILIRRVGYPTDIQTHGLNCHPYAQQEKIKIFCYSSSHFRRLEAAEKIDPLPSKISYFRRLLATKKSI